MPNREKVIKGLEHCLSRYVDGLCDDCPYMGELDKSYMIPMKCKEIIMRDALALLKEDCHNCKLECLLQKYDELKEKYDALLKEQGDGLKHYYDGSTEV